MLCQLLIDRCLRGRAYPRPDTPAVDPSAWEGFVSWLMGTTRFDIVETAGLKRVQRERKKTLVGVYGF